MAPSLESDETQRAAALLSLRNGGDSVHHDHDDNENNHNQHEDTHSSDSVLIMNDTSTNDDNNIADNYAVSHRVVAGGNAAPSPMELEEPSLAPVPAEAAGPEAAAPPALHVEPHSQSPPPNGPLHFEDLPTTEEEARSQLETLFCYQEWAEKHFDHVLETLGFFPSLCSEFFADYSGAAYLPLSHFLYANTVVDAINEILNLNPDVLSIPQGMDQRLPLHIACSLDFVDDVAMFLAKKLPLALTKCDSMGMLPIHVAMGRHILGRKEKAPFCLIRTLIGLYPQSVSIPTSSGMTALDYAVHGDYDIFVLNCILARLPPIMQQFIVRNAYHNKAVVLDVDKMRIIEKILPRVQQFQADPAQWQAESLLYVMQILQNDPAETTKVKLAFPPSCMTSECRFAFKQALELNTHISCLLLNCSDQDTAEDCSDFLESLRLGLAANETIQALRLSRYKGRLLDVITQGPSVEVTRSVFLPQPDWHPKPDKLKTLRMSTLVLGACTISPACLRKLLQELVHAPSLQSLTLDVAAPEPACENTSNDNAGAVGNTSNDQSDKTSQDVGELNKHVKEFDMTAPLLAIIGKGKLKKLTLGANPLIDIPSLCEELKQNTSLSHLTALSSFAVNQVAYEAAMLTVLARHNTTLVQVNTSNKVSDNQQIYYFTKLNVFGRKKARDEATTRPAYVELLCSLAVVNVLEGLTKHSLCFGLLRESPGLWSSASSSAGAGSPTTSSIPRKRKSGDCF